MHTIPDTESLQPEEQEVVVAAAGNRGAFQIVVRPETRGPVIQAGQKKLFQKDEPNFAKRCCDSVSRLIELQLVRENRRTEALRADQLRLATQPQTLPGKMFLTKHLEIPH